MGATRWRRQAAQERAVLDRLRQEKPARAKTHPQEEKRKGAPSVSSTNPEARRMRFADGAVRASDNRQTAAVPAQGLIVAVKTTDRRNDHGLTLPLITAVARRYGRAPSRLLLDEGDASRAAIEALVEHPAGPVTVDTPPQREKPEAALGAASRPNRHDKRAKEPQAVKH